VASSSSTAVAGSPPSQDKSVDFLQSTQDGCQSNTTTTSNVPLGKDQYLQARPDHRHGWGAEDTANVDQSSLGRRLLLRLSSRCLFSGSSDRFCAPLSSRGWRVICAKSSSTMGAGLRLPPASSPTVSQSPPSPCSTGSEGGISCKQGNFVVNTQRRDISTRLPYSRRLTSWDVVSETFNFLATRLRATLRGFLGGAGRLASRLAGGS
jgi:hypothetical protein